MASNMDMGHGVPPKCNMYYYYTYYIINTLPAVSPCDTTLSKDDPFLDLLIILTIPFHTTLFFKLTLCPFSEVFFITALFS